MCFSADADLAAGIVVSAIGIDAIRRVRTPSELPLASLPLLFGVHQLIEAFVWWGLEGRVPAALGDRAIWLYLVVAFVLPPWVPLAVRSVEPDHRRRASMTLLAGIGIAVALILLGAVVRGPIEAVVEGHHIEYSINIRAGVAVVVLYVIATCGALLVSSDRWIRSFGAVNLGAVAVLVWLAVGGLTSLWCVWAALTSVAIDLWLRDPHRRSGVVLA